MAVFTPMLFFKRILDVGTIPAHPAERRVATRFSVNREFPIQAVLNIAGRDEHGVPLKPRDREGWDWPGRLVDLSTTGTRLQVPLTVLVQREDPGRLKLDVQGYKLEIPCYIKHVTERKDSNVLGLGLDLRDPATQAAYRQLIELVALGASLKLVRPLKSDQSGYLLEEYAGEPASHLSVWRQKKDRELTAFEFLLKDCFVRGLRGTHRLECFAGTDAGTGRAVTPAQAAEIQRLYQWVVLNLARVVPADVRAFLLKHAL